MSEKQWAYRTVKDGRVKVFHKVFRPDDRFMTYDGRLDDQRFLFGVYWRPTPEGNLEHYMLGLWGTEEAARSKDPHYPDGPELVNGTWPWYWWYPVEGEKHG